MKKSEDKTHKKVVSDAQNEESIGKVQDRMTQMPKKKVPWTTFIIIFIVLALVYAVVTFAFP
ncbi:hypothetical protein [Allomuricauda sp. d1]|uniref:hypothetical protein n=1 Tax=Allomuricauda sp. d1 TaxID=3136725 RepID=UPI0031CF09A5